MANGVLLNSNCGCAVTIITSWQAETTAFMRALEKRLGSLAGADGLAIGNAFDAVVLLAKAGGSGGTSGTSRYVIQVGSPDDIPNVTVNATVMNGAAIPIPAGKTVLQVQVGNTLMEPTAGGYQVSAGVLIFSAAVQDQNVYLILKDA